MEEEPRTATIPNAGKKRSVLTLGGFSVDSGGGIVVVGVIFLGGVIATAAFSFLSRRRRDSSGNRDGEIYAEKDEEEEEEEELKKDFGIGSDKDMDQNLLRFDLIISSPLRLNHFGGIKETKLVTCIFRDGSSSYATAGDSAAVLEERIFRPPDKKNRLEFNCRNEDDEEFPLLLPNILQNSTDGDQEIKKFKIPILISGNIEEVPFQAAIREDNTMFIEAGVVENDEELDHQDGDTAGPHVVSEITETEERLASVVEDQIQGNGSKLNDYDSNSVILIHEEIHDNGNHDQMPLDNGQDQPKTDLIPGLAYVCDEEVPGEKFVKMQQVMYNLSKFNNDWIPEKELQKGNNISDKSSVNSSLIGRYALQLAELSEKTTSSSRKSVLVFTVMVLSGSLQPWYCSRPFPNLLLIHFKNYVMVKLHIMYRNHGRNHLKYRLVPKMLGI